MRKLPYLADASASLALARFPTYRFPRASLWPEHVYFRRSALFYGLAAATSVLPVNPCQARTWYFRLNVSTEAPEPDNIFAKILIGEAPAEVLDSKDDELFSFRDKNPASTVHILVIPRRFVRDAAELKPEDAGLVERMVEKARVLVRDDVGSSFDEAELLLGFHWPPWYSVPWLHLHAIYPRSKMRRRYKYTPISFKSPNWLLDRLAKQREGKHALRTWW